MNNPKKKRRSFSEYFASSIIVTFLMWLSNFIYNKAENGFYGKAITSYDAENKAAQNCLSYSLAKKAKYGEKVAHPIKQAIARSFEQSRILNAIISFFNMLLYCSQKIHGIFFVSFGLYIEIVFFIKNAINSVGMKDADFTPVLIGAVLMIMALPLIFSNQSLAQGLCESKISSFILFKVIGAKPEAFTKNQKCREHLYTPFIIGMLFGLLTFFVSPVLLLIALMGILLVYTILCIPEFGLLLLVALVPFAPTMLLAGLTIFISFAFFIKLIRGKRSIKYSLNDLMITIFTVITLIGGFISPNVAGSIKPALIYTIFLLGYFLCANFISTKQWLNKCLFALTASLFVVSALGVAQYVFGFSMTTWQDTSMFSDIEGRVYSTFENPNVLAEYIIMILPLTIALIVGSTKRSTKAASLVSLASALMCLVFTWSRGAWLGFLFSVIIFLLIYSRKIFALLLSLIFFIPFLPFVLPDSIMNRFSSIGNLADTSTSYRVNIWSGVTRMLKDYWFTGIGTGNPAFKEVYPAYSLSGIEAAPHSHNLFFQIITEHGVIALILFAIIIWFYIQSVFTFNKYESNKSKFVAVALMCGILAVLLQGLTDYIWYNYRVYLMFWILIGLTSASRRCHRITRI